MEITRENFTTALDTIDAAITEASFLAIDAEFTGLSNDQESCKIHALDTPEERYHKNREGSMEFLIVQFGLCTFQYDESKEQYTAKPFNFYIFSKPFNRQAPDIRFMCQSSSVDFLIYHGFDFNKVFKQGISYLAPEEEKRLREALQQKHKQIDVKNEIGDMSPSFSSPTEVPQSNMAFRQIPAEHQSFMQDICDRIEKFLNCDEEVMTLEPCNGYLRKLTYIAVSKRFKSKIHLEASINEKRQRYIVITKVSSEEELHKKEEEKRAAEFAAIDDAVGFCKVVKMISQSGKLVVGHNMLLDLMHVLNRFVCTLPQDYDEFKTMTNTIFPRILDTKLMASSSPFTEILSSTALPDLKKALESSPFPKTHIGFAEGFEEYATAADHLHEAAYDAFITGVCLISMSTYLENLGDASKSTLPIVPSSVTESYMNKIYIMLSRDIPFMNFNGPDLEPGRDHVFHVTFPKEWKASTLSQLFSPFGGGHITWINQTDAFVSLYRKDEAQYVLQTLSKNNCFHIVRYHDYMAFTRSTRKVKRKVPDSDLQQSSKQKRSRMNSESPYSSNRSMNTIPEEDEAMEHDKPENSRSFDNDQQTNFAKEDKDKLFEEPVQW